MEGLKEFLESSTIHGLVYISTTRRLVRLLWISVVIGGFLGAGLLIQESFSSWSTSPVSTTVEILSISDLKFPNVTVCPPRNSFTSLNPVLVLARKVKFDETRRKELVADISDVIYNGSLLRQYSEHKEYSTEGHYHWYTGETKELAEKGNLSVCLQTKLSPFKLTLLKCFYSFSSRSL